MKLTAEELREIAARAEAATAGPWTANEEKSSSYSVYKVPVAYGNAITGWGRVLQSREDATFIAHARTDIPRLLAHIDQQQAEIERLRQERARILYQDQ